MSITGLLHKMDTVHEETVRYALPLSEARVPLNERLGQQISLKFTGKIFCLECGARTRTSFGQGHCWTCFQTKAALDNCIVRPHTCHHHLGTCREPEWGERHCFVPHTVYLANSSGLKVGITRSHTVRMRWMDQGAVEALPIAVTQNRLDCGLIEHALSVHVADKTHWRRMLSGVEQPVDLRAARDRLFGLWGAEFPGEKVVDAEPVRFLYPVLKYPEKAVSLNAAKNPDITGTLLGIKGQYLILDVGVINIRTHSGHEATVSVD
jgi:hypothetical protein